MEQSNLPGMYEHKQIYLLMMGITMGLLRRTVQLSYDSIIDEAAEWVIISLNTASFQKNERFEVFVGILTALIEKNAQACSKAEIVESADIVTGKIVSRSMSLIKKMASEKNVSEN